MKKDSPIDFKNLSMPDNLKMVLFSKLAQKSSSETDVHALSILQGLSDFDWHRLIDDNKETMPDGFVALMKSKRKDVRDAVCDLFKRVMEIEVKKKERGFISSWDHEKVKKKLLSVLNEMSKEETDEEMVKSLVSIIKMAQPFFKKGYLEDKSRSILPGWLSRGNKDIPKALLEATVDLKNVSEKYNKKTSIWGFLNDVSKKKSDSPFKALVLAEQGEDWNSEMTKTLIEFGEAPYQDDVSLLSTVLSDEDWKMALESWRKKHEKFNQDSSYFDEETSFQVSMLTAFAYACVSPASRMERTKNRMAAFISEEGGEIAWPGEQPLEACGGVRPLFLAALAGWEESFLNMSEGIKTTKKKTKVFVTSDRKKGLEIPALENEHLCLSEKNGTRMGLCSVAILGGNPSIMKRAAKISGETSDDIRKAAEKLGSEFIEIFEAGIIKIEMFRSEAINEPSEPKRGSKRTRAI